jgi:hypothetical protein
MKAPGFNPQFVNAYLNKFQESQFNLNALIKEARIQKRIEKSRKKQSRLYD